VRRARLAAPLAALALCAGCRLAVEEVHDGVAPDPARIARLAAGRSTLDDALGSLGAPDRVEWVAGEDVLVYASAAGRRTRWTLENPLTYVGATIGARALAEATTYALYTAEQTRARPPEAAPEAPRHPRTDQVSDPRTVNPLALHGAIAGREEVRLFFDRASGLLTRIEVARLCPPPGPGGIAENAFLR
jgi:hypothetical protein